MTNAFHTLWRDAVVRLRPQRTFLVGPGADGIAASLLSLTQPWGGLVDLAWPDPAEGQPAQDGHRFTLHRARPQDTAGLLPLPALVIVEPGDAHLAGHIVAGLLRALKVQCRRLAKPFPLVLLHGIQVAKADQNRSPAEEQRPEALAAVEDFSAMEAPDLIHGVLPLLPGIATVVGRADVEEETTRAVLSSLTLGSIARLAVAEVEAARTALQVENDRLREDLAAAELRTDYLLKALRRAQVAVRTSRDAHINGAESGLSKPIQAPRRALGKFLAVAGWRDRGSAQPQPDCEAAIARLRRSPVLSEGWYQAQYPDVAASGMDPAEHYYRHGAAEGRDPGPDFVTSYYLASEPDVAQSGVNPLLHFLDNGWLEGRSPSPDFDSAFYLAANPDVAEAGVNPLEHFVTQGRAEGRRGLPPR